MDRSLLPLNALRAFEASARHLSFTRAGLELRVSQAAVSHHVGRLEARLGMPLFRRLSRGLTLTDEGAALVPVLGESFDRIAAVLDRYEGGRLREVLTLGVVGTFAVGWLLPRLPEFVAQHPFVDLRIRTNNNRVDLAGEGLDVAIRFGDGAWHGVEALPLMAAPLVPFAAPGLAASIESETALITAPLLRSYRADEWPRWCAAAGVACPVLHGPMFDSSLAAAAAAVAGCGVALLPPTMFGAAIDRGDLISVSDVAVDTGRYWLARLKTRAESDAMRALASWLTSECAPEIPSSPPPVEP